jgi:hypothetical protein
MFAQSPECRDYGRRAVAGACPWQPPFARAPKSHGDGTRRAARSGAAPPRAPGCMVGGFKTLAGGLNCGAPSAHACALGCKGAPHAAGPKPLP